MTAQKSFEDHFNELVDQVGIDDPWPSILGMIGSYVRSNGLSRADGFRIAERLQAYRVMDVQVSSLKAYEPDLTITISAVAEPIYVESRRGALNFSPRKIDPLKGSGDIAREIRDALKDIYYDKPDEVGEVRDWFETLSMRMTKMVPESLLTLLKDDKVKSVELNVHVSVDFPIELCWLDHEDGGALLCDKAEITRWYVDTRAASLTKRRVVTNIGFVQGKLADGYAGESIAVLGGNKLPTGSISARTDKDVRDQIFKSSNIDLLHYKGHIENEGKGNEPELSMADSNGLPLAMVDLAVGKKHALFKTEPFVFLNGCDGAVPTPLIGGHRNFPYSFVEGDVVGVVSTMWQVGEEPGEEFTRQFYLALRQGKRVPQAIRQARDELRKRAEEYANADDGMRFKLYYIGMHAYVYYGAPDLTIGFAS